jgi:hypothetical protein
MMINSNCRIIIIMLVACFMIAGCSNPTSEKKQAQKTAISVSEPEVASKSHETSNNINKEQIAKTFSNLSHYSIILEACGNYQIAKGIMPQRLEDLLDGFMLIWPGSIYTGKPVKIISVPPDATNPDHIGTVYYERVNDFEANIYFPEVDVQKTSSDGKLAWFIDKKQVEPRIRGTAGDKTFADSDLLSKIPPDERELLGYKMNLFHTVEIVMRSTLQEKGSLSESFNSLLNSENYYVFRNGWEKLGKLINDGKISYNFGDTGDKTNFYYETILIDLKAGLIAQDRKCMRIEKTPEETGGQYIVSIFDKNELITCPEPGSGSNSIFNVEALKTGISTFDKMIQIGNVTVQ